MSATRDANLRELQQVERQLNELAAAAKQDTEELILAVGECQGGTIEAIVRLGSEFGQDGGESTAAAAQRSLTKLIKGARQARSLATRMATLQGKLASV